MKRLRTINDISSKVECFFFGHLWEEAGHFKKDVNIAKNERPIYVEQKYTAYKCAHCNTIVMTSRDAAKPDNSRRIAYDRVNRIVRNIFG